MLDTETMLHIWNKILYSNTFNFIIFVAILGWIFKKIDVKAVITALQKKIIHLIDEAKKEKDAAETELKNAHKAVENLGEELKTIVDDAARSAEVIGEKIMTEAQKQLENIENNATKVIEAEEKMLVSNLTKSTSLASVEHAKSHIQNALKETPTLHEKYINESIQELDRLNF